MGVPAFWFKSAVNPAHNCATALVPPMPDVAPFNTMRYGLFGDASAATSGTVRRCCPSFTLVGNAVFAWKAGTVKKSLTPPPVPEPAEFHTTSVLIVPPLVSISVPPHPIAQGLDAGKSTFALLLPRPSFPRSSPEATKTDVCNVAASCSALLITFIAGRPQFVSAVPQLMEITFGWYTASVEACEMASAKPRVLFGAKYTAIVAPGAMPPATDTATIVARGRPIA